MPNVPANSGTFFPSITDFCAIRKRTTACAVVSRTVFMGPPPSGKWE